ncbi:hypothetical protein FIBSPDRAFT_181175 [Athelia psychrophila]|uniref:Uncharacterized protein n=1 Tax=Athelia psychrophila TaxID=1759441 RepID=A0A166AJQ3_9AGAM|nr:hypothetical protein FIBSPDRAFT_181175 [Fibularhizoctonia sp. CBS 109695]
MEVRSISYAPYDTICLPTMTSTNSPAGPSVINYVQGSQYNYVHHHYHYYHSCQLQSRSATTSETVPKAREGLDAHCACKHEHHHHFYYTASRAPEDTRKTRLAKGKTAHRDVCGCDDARERSSRVSVGRTRKFLGKTQEGDSELAPVGHTAGKKGEYLVSDEVLKVAITKCEQSAEVSTRRRRYAVFNSRLELQTKRREEASTVHTQRVFSVFGA